MQRVRDVNGYTDIGRQVTHATFPYFRVQVCEKQMNQEKINKQGMAMLINK